MSECEKEKYLKLICSGEEVVETILEGEGLGLAKLTCQYHRGTCAKSKARPCDCTRTAPRSSWGFVGSRHHKAISLKLFGVHYHSAVFISCPPGSMMMYCTDQTHLTDDPDSKVVTFSNQINTCIAGTAADSDVELLR